MRTEEGRAMEGRTRVRRFPGDTPHLGSQCQGTGWSGKGTKTPSGRASDSLFCCLAVRGSISETGCMRNRIAIFAPLFLLASFFVAGIALAAKPSGAKSRTWAFDFAEQVDLQVGQPEYDPFGRRSVFDANGNLLSVTAVQNLRGYTSHLHDFETGFIYMRNRYFHPGIGRFLTLDPLGVWYDSGNWGNGYGYGGGNPITIWDPHGEFGLLGLFVGAVVGGLYAAATGGNVLEGALTGAAIGAGVGVGLGALGTGAKIGAAALSGLGAGLSVANAPGAVGRAVDTAGKLLKGKISPTKAALKVGKVAVEQLAWKKVSTAGGWLIKQGQKIPGLKKLCGLLSRWFGKKQKKRLKKKKPRGPPDERGGGILWRSWGGYEKVTVGRREYAKVGDRLYTRHAVDRMQPSGLGTPAGGSGSGRSISPNFVEDVIQNGTARSVTVNGVERTIHTSGSVQVVTEQGGRIVVTVNPFSGGK